MANVRNKESWLKYQQYKNLRDPSVSIYWRKYNAYKRLRSGKTEVSLLPPEKTMSEQLSAQF